VSQHKDHNIRKRVLDTLWYLEPKDAIPILSKALIDKNYEVRNTAALRLVLIDTNEAAYTLIPTLMDQDHSVRNTAIQLLKRICSDESVVFLSKFLIDEKSRSHIKVNKTEDINLFSDERSKSCKQIIQTLWQLGNENAVPVLVYALNDESSTVISEAACGLGIIGGKIAIAELVKALYHPCPYVRRISASSLGSHGSLSEIPELLKVIERNKLVDFSTSIEEILNKAYAHSSSTIRDMAEKYESTNTEIKKLVLEMLISSLNSEASSFRQASSDAIQQIRDRQTLEEVNKTYEEDNKASNISKLHDDLKNGDYLKRIEAMDKLAEIDDVTIVPELLGIFNSGDHIIRFNSANTIGKVASPEILPELLKILLDSQDDLVLHAIRGIQARCKYYSYKIYDTPLQEIENNADPVKYTLNELTRAVKKMSDAPKSDAPKYDLRGAKIGKLIDTIGVYNENNFAPEQKQSLADAVKEIQDLLDQLAKTYPSATEAEAKDIVKATFEEIKTKHPDKWKILWTQILKPERWLNGGKAALSEATKHYAENSVILKVTIAFLDGFSADEE
jgi:HEAT repeat protein